MVLIQNIKRFFSKESYDFEKPDITIFDFHPQLRVYYMINGVFFNNNDSKIRFILPIVNTALSLISIAFELMFIYRGLMIEDYAFASESFCYIIILSSVPIVYISIIYNRDVILKLLDEMNKDFIYISGLGARYKKPFMKGQLLIWKMCWLWLTFCICIGIVYMLNTLALLIYQSLFVTHNENTVRPLIFPMWLPEDDPYRTPNYEIFMVFHIALITIIEQTYCAYVYMQFHIQLHYYFMMDMIILDLNTLFEGLDESVVDLPKDDPQRMNVQAVLNQRLGRITRWHVAVFESVKTVSSVYGPPLVYCVLLSSVAICIIAFRVAETLKDGKIDYLFVIMEIAACLQLWIPCFLGTLIRDKAFSVGDTCWGCGWQETSLGRLVRNDIIIMIHRAQRPLTIQFSGLPNLSLETFSSIMSTSYSYFNMLRQSTK